MYQLVCPPLASITDYNLVGMEWHKAQSLVLLTNVHFLSKITFFSSKVLGHDWPYWTASLKSFQTFSNGLRSGLFVSHLSFSIRHNFLHSSSTLLQCNGAPSFISIACETLFID
jgi:hypothetical protein